MSFHVNAEQLHVRTDFPHAVREIEHTWIPMPDGARLAARIWLPVDAETQPVPVLLEYIPYRKVDSTAQRDSLRHPYFAGHGYASVRVDMRGSGESDGVLYGEYLQQEQDDALVVIEWLAAQPWSTGKVGMFGKSWGGFNALQVAARRPPALKAIITLCSTDDRYADDVHYRGGCLLASDMLWWASIMLAYNARPPDPQLVGERWRDLWLERLEQTPPFVEEWVRHQRRDAFWQHGSVCENYADITVPVFAVGGWADGYTNAIFRLLANLQTPRLGLIGPWAHEYPEVAAPGPAIGFLQECLRWWDHWLKDANTGIMQEPMLRAWLQEQVPPQSWYTHRPGRWIAESNWPPQREHGQPLSLVDGRLLDPVTVTTAATPVHFSGAQSHGLYAGVWCPFGQAGDLASDQRREDGLALCFDSPPLQERQEILGFPTVTLTLSSDQPQALIAVRLCAVAPTGASTLVSWGLLNLTHRVSHEFPTPLSPGQPVTVTVQLNAIGWALPVDHRWRVALSPTDWPHAWPSPVAVTLALHGGQLTLPIRPPRVSDADLRPFAQPEVAPLIQHEVLRTESRTRTVQQNLVSGVMQLVDHSDEGVRRLLPSGITFETVNTTTYNIVEDDPLSAHVQSNLTVGVGRGEWQTRVETASSMRADANHYYLTNAVNAFESNRPVFAKTWHATIPRDL